MGLKRIILELGTGNDLYGQDYTKAACRAVQDALHHSSLTLLRSLGLDRDAMVVNITVGVQQPDSVNTQRVAEQVPYGTVQVRAVLGGLDVIDAQAGTTSVIASVGVEALLELPEGQFILPSNS